MTTSTTDYALLSLSAYPVHDKDKNLIDLEALGWKPERLSPNDLGGFSYGVFRRIGTNEIVMAYTGSDEHLLTDYLGTNIPAGLGLPSVQIPKAALAYLDVVKEFGTDAAGSNITLTGHSLGGGLASVMAVWFNRPAVVFDEAPFQASALSPLVLAQTQLELWAKGYFNFAPLGGAFNFSGRESLVTNHYLQGEVLASFRFDSNTVGTSSPAVSANIAGLDGGYLGLADKVTLHSQELLATMLVSNAFRNATFASDFVVPVLTDPSFYAYDPAKSAKQDIFINLIRGEQGPGKKLTHFAADLQTLGTDIPGLNAAAQKAIIAQGMEWYYWQGSDYAGQQFFVNGTSQPGLLQYTTAQGDQLADAENKAADYASAWLSSLYSANGAVGERVDFDQWTVATGTTSVTATARTALKSQVFIGNDAGNTATMGDQADVLFGGGRGDTLSGGGGADTVYGGAGNDVLNGGTGADVLYGGDDADTYFVDNSEDVVVETVTGGHDTVHVTGNMPVFWVPTNVEDVTLDAGFEIDAVDGNASENRIVGNSFTNGLFGEGGDDTLIGGGHDFTIYNGGTGDDTLQGTAATDFYTFDLGGGWDTIIDPNLNGCTTDKVNVLRFGEGISPTDVTKVNSGNDVIYKLANGRDQVTIKDGLLGNLANNLRVVFADGDKVRVVQGTTGHDYLGSGSAAAGIIGEVVYGLAGSDEMCATGGVPSYLAGGDGLDIYRIYGPKSSLNVTHTCVPVIAALDDSDNGGVVYYGSSPAQQLSLEGGSYLRTDADGTVVFQGTLVAYQLNAKVQYAYSTTKNTLMVTCDDGGAFQVVNAFKQNLSLNSISVSSYNGTVSATILGMYLSGAPAGTFAFPGNVGPTAKTGITLSDSHSTTTVVNAGAGSTVIASNATDDVSLIQFGAGISQANVAVTRNGADLVLALANGTDSVTLKDWYSQVSAAADTNASVHFMDGSRWTAQELTLRGLAVSGTSGADTLLGLARRTNSLEGMAGADTLIGADSADVLIGGAGNDLMQGGLGADTYLVNLGDGADIITEIDSAVQPAGSADLLRFGAGIAASDVTVHRVGADLVLQNSQGTDSVTVRNWYTAGNSTANQVERVEFADGTTWLAADLTTRGLAVTGAETSDTLSGLDGFANVLSGMAGNDTLAGGTGNDTLEGGTGNDLLLAGTGNDTYLYHSGDGADTITDTGGTTDKVQLTGLTSSAAKVRRIGNDMSLTFAGTDQSLTVTDWFLNSTNKIESFVFDDATLTAAEMETRTRTVVLTEGSDTYVAPGAEGYTISGLGGYDNITGGAGDDVLTGGAYYDVLAGGAGADTYLFNQGDWGDVITESGESAPASGPGDTVKFGAGLTAADWSVTRYGTDLMLARTGSHDSLTVKNWYTTEGSTVNQVESVLLADGSVAWTAGALTTLGLNVTGTAGADVMQGLATYANVLNGGDGADILYGASGADSLYGGAGNDYIDGGAGQDYLSGGAGDDMLGGPGPDRGYLNTTGAYISPGAGNVYEGGTGNDVLNGTSMGDTYKFNLGDGADAIADYEVLGQPTGQVDTIEFGAGINPADIYVSRSGNNLQLRHVNGQDSITIFNWYRTASSTDNQVERVTFSNNVQWTAAELTTRGLTVVGSAGGDVLTGIGDYANVLDGRDGDDSIYGGTGDDTLWGGNGNDQLLGQAGNDHLYGGDGNDYLDGGPDVDFLDGGAGNDIMFGSENNDQLWGGTGNDAMHGGSGDDLLMGESGDDLLYGDSGTNTLNGGLGNDTLYSVGTLDQLWGAGGYDTYVIGTGLGTHVVHEDSDGGMVDVSSFFSENKALTAYLIAADQLCLNTWNGEVVVLSGWAASNVGIRTGTHDWTAAEINQQFASHNSFQLLPS